jgi:hypothetical protein
VLGAEDVPAMPPKGKRLSDQQVAALRAWIDAGAKTPSAEVEARSSSPGNHWSFRPITRPPMPPVRDTHWVRNPIDHFVLARLEKEGVRPSPEADFVTLARRVSLDLTGLLPSPQQIDGLRDDPSPDAYERFVERLLASPHYGERWGRHWLDQARYADSNGYSIDAPRSIWKYRDWVLDAFNRDLPFDRFVIEQLAGDMLPGATTEQRIATGFHRNSQINQEGGIDEEQFRVEAIVDRVNTTGTALLGLTVGCAQCHDHKFDPLSQREYYRLFAFFNSCEEPTLELPTAQDTHKRREVEEQIRILENRLRTLDDATPQRVLAWEGGLSPQSRSMLPPAIQAILAIATNGRNPDQEWAIVSAYRNAEQTRHAVGGLGQPLPFLAAAHLQAHAFRRDLQKQIARLHKQMPAIASTMVVAERKEPRITYIQLGGDFLRKGAEVTAGVPAVLPTLKAEKASRLDLARWFVDGRNPLPPRVTMNRFWQQYFGLGIVETENDVGTQGTPPSHPELLDWLAAEFVDRVWSMKAMHRLIVTSATYRQSSRARPDLATLDPRNRLLARQNRLRLDAEVVRDVALCASGLLTRKVGGPSVYPPQPRGVYQFTQIPRDWQASTGADRYRRGMYTFVWRSAPHPELTVFDAPDGVQTCTRRNRSNTPLQALTLLNDEGFLEYAEALAGRILSECPGSDSSRINYAFRLCLGRPPSSHEHYVLGRLLVEQREDSSDPKVAWTSVARALLNLDEFITRE